jgi:4-carboxymuconolactone decarboxylase
MDHDRMTGTMHSDDPFDRGAALLARLSPEGAPPPWVSFADVAPALGRSVGTAFGTIISRPGLDLRTRELTTVAVLATLGGCEPQVAFHVGAALRAGASGQEIVEALTQVSVYAGVPRALNAVAAARDAFRTAGVDVTAEAPRAVIVAFVDALTRGDRMAAWALLDDEIVIRVPGMKHTVPFAGTWTGRREVEDFARALAASVRMEDVRFDEPLPTGDVLYVPVTFLPAAGPDTATHGWQGVLRMRVRQGRLAEVVVHGDVSGVPMSTTARRTDQPFGDAA